MFKTTMQVVSPPQEQGSMTLNRDASFVRRTVFLALTLIASATFLACERDMTISLTKESNPPSFKLSGSGRLIFFSVSDVARGKPSSIDDPAMWEIRPVDEDLISKLPEITYGVVPPGFNQTFPKNGAPPPLVEGKLYEAGGPAYNANGGSIRFVINDGSAMVEPSER